MGDKGLCRLFEFWLKSSGCLKQQKLSSMFYNTDSHKSEINENTVWTGGTCVLVRSSANVKQNFKRNQNWSTNERHHDQLAALALDPAIWTWCVIERVHIYNNKQMANIHIASQYVNSEYDGVERENCDNGRLRKESKSNITI